uniref:F-box domain-containing protein n=1 Tax=Phlebotomus papatasi TaxID=29031 RepID=A0A1B0DM17_PHLPP
MVTYVFPGTHRILEELMERQDGTSRMYFMFLLRPDCRKFKVKNIMLPLSYWESIFTMYFQNLVFLNLSLSCTDYILRFVPRCCPNLEVLNATCRYERMRIGLNAAAFSLSVTDAGLEHLCECQKLRILVVNEPRSQSRGIQTSITYNGLRKLLQSVKTLENITYSDLGSVIGKGMETVDSLNLRLVKHFNATGETMGEILRLCTRLENLSLTFFNNEYHDDVLQQIVLFRPKLTGLQIINFNCNRFANTLFTAVGAHLQFLHIAEHHEPLKFHHLLTIGQQCPALKHLTILNYSDDLQQIGPPPNFNQFSHMELFELGCTSINFPYVMLFCLQNAQNTLHSITLTHRDHDKAIFIDEFLLKHFTFRIILEITISSCYRFSRTGIEQLLLRHETLQYLNVHCPDDCGHIRNFIKNNNLDVVFINKLHPLLD